MPKKNERLQGFARRMRRAPTPGEDWLWSELRNRRFLGVKFRRQSPIGPYIVDFASHDPKLVVELEGSIHDGTEEYDLRRQRWLEDQGFTVLRFGKTIPVCDGPDLLLILKETIERLRCFSPLAEPPHPGPLPRGERET